MELKPNMSHVLMSETLKGQLPGLDGDDPLVQFAGQAVYVIIDRRIGGQPLPLSGVLSSILFGAEPEVEVHVELSEALVTVKADNVQIVAIELHHGEETTVPVPGPFTVKAARIDDIDVATQSCILALQLQRVKNV